MNCAVVDRLRHHFHGWEFTPHRHPTGCIREMIVAYMFRPTLCPGHEATTETGESVRTAFIQNDEAVIYRQEPQHLLVLRLSPNCLLEVIFDKKRGGNFDDFFCFTSRTMMVQACLTE